MYQFNNTKDLSKAVDMYGDYSKQELITMLCYYRDRLNLENKHLIWLDDLASYLRDTSNKEQERVSDESYEEYKLYNTIFNNKWN
jgi:hypothetical protein